MLVMSSQTTMKIKVENICLVDFVLKNTQKYHRLRQDKRFLTLNKFLLHKAHIIGYFSTLYTVILILYRKASPSLLLR